MYVYKLTEKNWKVNLFKISYFYLAKFDVLK